MRSLILSALARRLAAAALPALLLFGLGACEPEAYPDTVVYEGGALFRTQGERFQMNRGGGWHDLFIKAVNLAVATPGKYPGELNLVRADYDRWLKYIADLNCNAVRLYTLHYPVFYEALGAWNKSHPSQAIYLIQGIWLDEFDHGDYITDGTNQLDEEIRYVVDAVHGRADIPHRYGKAHGAYRHDVSRFVLAWLPGHEMDGRMVKAANTAWAAYGRYNGYYISSPQGLPIEAWVARALDHVVLYEGERYGQQRPVAFCNWPTLDPMTHPYETDIFAQDLVNTDFGRFKTHNGFTAGIFVSYHIYPFYPEFIIYDPTYVNTVDQRGLKNNYLGYLRDLRSRHQGVPLLVSEFGIPSSMGVAHVNTLSYSHGGYSEANQSQAVYTLYQDIVAAGAAGAVVFELLDEWFKSSWMNKPTTQPSDRGRFWYDLHDPEESFGLVSHYPIQGVSRIIDGQVEDWTRPEERLTVQDGATLAAVGDGRDFARTLRGLHMAADPAFLFIRLDVGTTGLPDLDQTVYYIGLSTVGGKTGDQRFPEVGVKVPPEQGLESVVVLDGKNKLYQVLTDREYDPTPMMNGKAKTGGIPTANDNGTFDMGALIVNNSEQYKLAGKGFVPEMKYFKTGELRKGSQITDTSVHFELGTGGIIELRIPWQALWVTDPSSRRVLHDDPFTQGFETAETSGFTVVVVTAARTASGLKVVDVLPRTGYQTGSWSSLSLPFFSWKKWDSVTTTERLKPVYYMMQNAFRVTP